MELYLRFFFQLPSGIEQDFLLADLSEYPFEGFEETGEGLWAYILATACDEELRNFMQQRAAHYGIDAPQEETLEPKNWNETWEKEYEPVIVDDFCAVLAHFHPAAPQVQYSIEITPKMSFGTGHHATTYMMMQAMRDIDFLDKVVLDYGCGTAVLAILAQKMGAKEIIAIDNDPWAYENSLENSQLNHCGESISILQGDESILAQDKKYDVILANINRNIILASMDNMAAALLPGGLLYCSGFLEADVALIEAAAQKSGLLPKLHRQREQWQCLGFEKREVV